LPIVTGNPDPRERFVADVERLRESRGWSVEELAERAQMDVAEVEAILDGEGEVPLDALMLLARGLGVPPGQLIDGTVEMPDDGPQ
jgi:transcriptional regulator with XRE-family HTH domain